MGNGQNGELSSDMPGTEEFEGMTEKDLGEQLPEQGAPGSGPSPKKEPAQAAEQAEAPGQEDQTEQAVESEKLEPKPEDTIKTLQAKIDLLEKAQLKMSRENRSYQALSSKLARLENELKQRGPSPTLSPEQQSAEAQRQEAEKYLESFMDKHLGEKYAHLLEPLRQQQFKSSVEQRCQDMGIDFAEMDPHFGKIIREDIALAKEGDEAALNRLNKITKDGDSTELLLRAIHERSKDLQSKGAIVQKKQAEAAKGGQRGLKPNGAKPAENNGKRSLADVEAMSDDDREGVPMEELEALIPRQNRR